MGFRVIEEENETIVKMASTNDMWYNFDKTIEELFELGEVLMKKKLKKGAEKEPSDQAIIEEIGDVFIRLEVLKLLFGSIEVEKRIEEKLAKFEGFYKEGKYIGSI
jgi:hypothetical protein